MILAAQEHPRTLPHSFICNDDECKLSLLYWQLLEDGKATLATLRDKKLPEAAELADLKKEVAQLERALGPKTYELEEVAGKLSRDWASRSEQR